MRPFIPLSRGWHVGRRPRVINLKKIFLGWAQSGLGVGKWDCPSGSLRSGGAPGGYLHLHLWVLVFSFLFT